mmetsp:Transcript_10264/g.24612  ORF Transcript_10264/g.24612 Transcript_10264/m.24612 type:complete len:164 (+) Transcript_10264:843-1334(+)
MNLPVSRIKGFLAQKPSVMKKLKAKIEANEAEALLVVGLESFLDCPVAVEFEGVVTLGKVTSVHLINEGNGNRVTTASFVVEFDEPAVVEFDEPAVGGVEMDETDVRHAIALFKEQSLDDEDVVDVDDGDDFDVVDDDDDDDDETPEFEFVQADFEEAEEEDS